jgi:hypothetical protein
MFTLPSIWNVLISTVVFVVAAWYTRRFLEEQGIPKGIARGLAVFMLAYLVSWASGEAVDFIQEKIEGPQAATKLDLGMPLNL